MTHSRVSECLSSINKLTGRWASQVSGNQNELFCGLGIWLLIAPLIHSKEKGSARTVVVHPLHFEIWPSVD